MNTTGSTTWPQYCSIWPPVCLLKCKTSIWSVGSGVNNVETRASLTQIEELVYKKRKLPKQICQSKKNNSCQRWRAQNVGAERAACQRQPSQQVRWPSVNGRTTAQVVQDRERGGTLPRADVSGRKHNGHFKINVLTYWGSTVIRVIDRANTGEEKGVFRVRMGGDGCRGAGQRDKGTAAKKKDGFIRQ